MVKILAVLMSAMLCIQPAYTLAVREPVSDIQTYEDTEEEDTESQETLQEVDEKEAEEEESESAGPEISAPSAILMEASTGQIIYEKSPDEKLPPASVTKIMTLLLIFDALNSGQIKLEDEVTTSEYAASMGGSQVFLEPGEAQTVETLIKCISVASANDACVAYNQGIIKLLIYIKDL